jgi:hypothetical protein
VGNTQTACRFPAPVTIVAMFAQRYSARRWEGQTALVRIPAAGHEAAQIDGLDRGSLATEEVDECRDDLIRRFLHQPVPRMTDDDAFHMRRHQPALFDQELA